MTVSQDPSSPGEFKGVIGRTYRDSKPWRAPPVRPPSGAPNVVLVVLDDVGFAQLGCYGSTINTPHLDALAAGGRRYNNFHTTSMCSPTRASLLTGRNHHAVGMGIITDWCSGYPGYQGEVSKKAATLAEMLRPVGYSTFAIGKWHLTRVREMTAAGPFDQWPLGRGFERYYGFLGALMDHWNPELIRDNGEIPTPRRPGYHLSEDLVEQTIAMIRDQQAVDPGRPFFAYLAFGATHSPHHAPREYIDRYAGKFDEGWDVMRERWFARQLELGIVPQGTRLTALNQDVTPWSSLGVDERRLCARHQEVFAGFLEHTDAQIGRLVNDLRSRGLLENTLFVVLSDNGATAEGGNFGASNLRRQYSFLEESFGEMLADIDLLGSEFLWNNYPSGWGHAGNTPLKWFKMHTHGGGIRDPLIVHWPAQIREGGLISGQFCHCSDIVPTVLEAVGVAAPEVVNGAEQLPVTGRSLLYTFGAPYTPAASRVQYFELMGNRGIWADGWKAVTHHTKGDRYEDDRWELYHVDSDFSEQVDVADQHPEKVAQLEQLWHQEALRNNVLPLDDRDRERTFYTFWGPPRRRWAFEQDMPRLSGYVAPRVANRSYRIVADVERTAADDGVILAAGGRAGGYVMFIQNGHLVHEYVGPGRRWTVESRTPLPAGRLNLIFEFRKQADCAGTGTLICNGNVVAVIEMRDMWPMGAAAGGTTCGYDDGSPVSERYELPFRFTGRILSAAVEAEDDYRHDQQLLNHISLSEE